MLTLDGSLDVKAIAPGVASELRCHVKVRAPSSVEAPVRGLVANICLVFDCSASMAGDKCDAAIDAAKRIVDTVDERHRISLVGFASSSRVVVDNATAKTGAPAVGSEVTVKYHTEGKTMMATAITAQPAKQVASAKPAASKKTK